MTCSKCDAAWSIVNKWSVIAGGTGAVPIPYADMPVLFVMQNKMVRDIGKSFDVQLDLDDAAAIAVTLGVAGFFARSVARQFLKFVPFAGWAISGAVAAAGTRAFGATAIRYFKNQQGCNC